jgi:hypothetical protein
VVANASPRPGLPGHPDLDRLSPGNLRALRDLYPEGSPVWVAIDDRLAPGEERSETPRIRRRLPEKEVEADIDRTLKALGFEVTRFSQPRASKQTLGIPDRYARHARLGLRLWIEVKAGKNRLSRHQEAWHVAERAAGGHVVTVWSVQDLVEELRALGVPLTG